MIRIKTYATLWGGERPRSPCCEAILLGDDEQFTCAECKKSYALYAEEIDRNPLKSTE